MHSETRSAARSVARGRGSLRRAALALVVLAAGPAEVARGQSPMPLPQVWTGNMIVPEGVQPGLTGDRFELRIFRLSTDQEIAELARELQSGGQVALRDAMYRLEGKGWIQIGKLVGTEIEVIRVLDLPDGRRRVRLCSSQPLRLYDKSEPAGSAAHPFAFIELVADASGAGTGSLVAAASLALVDGGLQIESAGTPVVKVIEVTTDRPPAPPARP